MFRLALRALALFLIAFVLGSGCGSTKQYHPKIQLTEGDTYALIIDRTGRTTITRNSVTIELTDESHRLYDIKVAESLAGGGASLDITYKSFSMSSSVRAGGMEIPALTNAKGRTPSEDIAGIVEGHTFSLELGADGSISSVKGLDALRNKIKSQIDVREYGAIALKSPEEIQSEEEKYIALQSDEHIALIFGEVFSVLPTDPIGEGDTWQVPELDNKIGNMYYDNRSVTFTRIEGNKAYARLTAAVASAPSARIKVAGQAISELAINLDTGLVTKQVLEESMSGASASEGVSNAKITVATTIEILKM